MSALIDPKTAVYAAAILATAATWALGYAAVALAQRIANRRRIRARIAALRAEGCRSAPATPRSAVCSRPATRWPMRAATVPRPCANPPPTTRSASSPPSSSTT